MGVSIEPKMLHSFDPDHDERTCSILTKNSIFQLKQICYYLIRMDISPVSKVCALISVYSSDSLVLEFGPRDEARKFVERDERHHIGDLI